MHYYTYAYLREDKTPYYIGKGKGNRAYVSNGRANKPPTKDRILILKENLTEKEAFRHEVYMIAVFGRKDLGTGILRNLTNGGDGTSGCIPSEETRRKMSEAGKGRIFSEEHRKKIGESNKRRIVSVETRKKMSERIRSEETRKKMSESGKVKIFSEEHRRKITEATQSKETRRKMSESGKVKIFSEEHKRNLSKATKGENNPNYGKTRSEETGIKIREARKGRKWWNDGCGNRKFVLECPGDGWKLGMK